MSITRARFELALEQIKPEHWSDFEKLSSSFLVTEFVDLRSMASPSGDGGRDAELYRCAEEPALVIQYSVTGEFKEKVRGTIRRLQVTFPAVDRLIYMTSQVIGAKSDDLIREYRKLGFEIDIRDQGWFLDRANTDNNRQAAAEELAAKFVDPLLPSREIDRRLVAGMSTSEAKTALLFLEMQIQDSSKDYGLTKLSYEAFALAALRDTDTSKRLSRAEIHKKVASFLPSHTALQINARVDAALNRLCKNAIRHRKDKDEYHLRDDEKLRVIDSAARVDASRRTFENDLVNALASVNGITIDDQVKFVQYARVVLETYFLRKGEDFARAAINSEPHELDQITLKSVVQANPQRDIGIKGRNGQEVTLKVLENILVAPGPGTDDYIKILLQSYTLFTFLAATPDVQKATRTMFGSGEIWLDTSIILPLFAEVSARDSRRPLTEMISQCRLAGLKLFVTPGVIEEVERHINRCLAYGRSNSWNGNVPFLYASYVYFGGQKGKFASWIERFMGDRDPEEDISDYLRRVHYINTESADDHRNVPSQLADAVRDIWQEIHIARRGNDLQALRLASHDTENYLHVLSSRIAQKGRAPLGYSDWWLTLDGAARTIMDRVDHTLRPKVNVGPVISIDFLLRYLAFGPNRERSDAGGAELAKIYAGVIMEAVPPDLLKIVEDIRQQHEGLPEHIVERRIRDGLNDERSRLGQVDAAGLTGAIAAIDELY